MKSSKYPFVRRCKAILVMLAFVALGRPAAAQVNDLCAGAITLTSNLASCVTTAGSITAATTYTAFGSSCAGVRDVWYSFTAQSVNPTITVSGALSNPRVQVITDCISLSSFGCSGSGTYNPIGLTIGTTYLIRVYSSSNATGNFNICISDPTPPGNDNCSGATSISSNTSCSTTAGTLLSATKTSGVPGDCGAVGAADVWYKFTANSAYPIINLGSVGVSLAAAGMRIQLLSGSCAAMTNLACVSGLTMNTYGVIPAPLTIGATYYIRIYTNTYPLNFAAQTFTICVQDLTAPTVEYSKTYVNITKGVNGGTIEPGDVLEMRTVFTVKAGTTIGTYFIDGIPGNTSYIPGTLRILTNEGQLYKQWTDASDGDPGLFTGSAVLINIGAGATEALGGMVKNTDRPTIFGSTCVMLVSYRITVGAAAYGTTIDLGNGRLSYVSPTNGATTTINFPSVKAKLSKNFGICANTIGGNGILSEFGGTFGNGNLKDRGPSNRLPNNYTYIKFSTGSPQDYYYGVSNNTSPGGANYSTNPNDGNSSHHVFNVWDIIGDHTGAASPTAGNPPGDTTGGKKAGYMVVINASYRADTAFLDTVRNLCPNTYYEYSAWFRNICKKCSGDSTGKGPGTAGYVPTGPGDSSGVHPNLTFNINGYDYYTTGDMAYSGQWVKKGFSYLTGSGETQMIISIRNNAPGGGGNDWAIDDIGVATCTPNLDITPSTPQVNVCFGDGASLSADVKSYFDNYTQYIWEKSLDSGVTWLPTGYAGPGVPVFDGTEYKYTAVGPSFIGDSSTNRNVFRLRVASSPTNMTDTSCSFSGLRTVMVYVHNCLWVLKADLLSASANLRDNYGIVQWQTTNETENTSFVIERSYDGTNFTAIANIKAHGVNGNGNYSYTDPNALTGTTFYRVKLVDASTFKYSSIFMLSPGGRVNFAVQNLINPFVNSVSCNVIIPADGDMRSTIFDMYGRVIKMDKTPVTKGIVPLKIQDLGGLSAGTYFLKIEWQNQSIIRKIVKTN